MATVIQNEPGGSRKWPQACGPEPHWGPGSGMGPLPGNAPPDVGAGMSELYHVQLQQNFSAFLKQ